jgi:hypothetical protein
MQNSNPFKQAFTENDGTSWCVVRIMGGIAGIEMMVRYYLFAVPDHSNFGIGISAILAAIAAKNFSEVRNGSP